MRLLFLTSRLPYPPVGGDRSRVFHFIRALHRSKHEVHLVCFDSRTRAPEGIEPLRRATASLRVIPLPSFLSTARAFRALAGPRPLQVAYYDSRRMHAAAKEAIARIRPDVVYTHLFRMAPYALARMPQHDACWILDLTDVISSEIERSLPYRRGFDRWLYAQEGRRIARYERLVAPFFHRCWVISEAEKRLLSQAAPGSRVDVVPIGLDFDLARTPRVAERESRTLLFFGYQKIFHNRDAAEFLATEIFPRVRAVIPDARLEIAGKATSSLGRWIRSEGITDIGEVPNPEEAFARATVFVAPHRFAAGVQTKVLQAMASGTPVVTTPLVRHGLEPIPPGLVRVGETAEGIAREVVSLIREPAAARELGERARDWALARFSWDHAVAAFESAAGPTAGLSAIPGDYPMSASSAAAPASTSN